MTKTTTQNIRCTHEEKEQWRQAAGGPYKVSAWLRALANRESEKAK